jgi:nitrite reductase (NADH) large subunit
VTLLNGRSFAGARGAGDRRAAQRPLAQASGIRCARGIVVDHQMQTSAPDV